MPVFEQGYRKYVGEKSTKPRAFAIAWENIRPRMRWWVWLLLFVLNFWPYLICAVGVMMASLGIGAAGRQATAAIAAAPTHAVAFERTGGPGGIIAMMTGDSLAFFWNLLDGSAWQSVILPAVACAGLFSADRRTGALQIYFARPVSRLDYLMGKIMAGTFFVALTTAVPALLVWIETVAFGTITGFTWKTWIAPLPILGASVFYALWSMGLVLSLSSVVRRPAFAALAAIFFQLAAETVGKIFGHTFHDPRWSLIQPSRAIGTMTTALFNVDLPSWVDVPTAFGIAVGIPIALLAFTWWRVRAVEVST